MTPLRFPLLALLSILIVVGIVALAGLIGVTLLELPTLSERYAESWGGKAGDHVPIVEGLRLTTHVGQRQMFTPAVCAPSDATLSDAVLTVSMSFLLAVEDHPGWAARVANDGSHVYTATFARPIKRGTCGNPDQALFFQPTVPGAHEIRYAISSAERHVVEGAFTVEAQ